MTGAAAGWPGAVLALLEWVWAACGTLCLAAAAAALLRPRLFARAKDALEGLDGRPVLRWAPAAVLGLGVPLLVCLWQLARYAIYEPGTDAAIMANAAWNFAHGFGWRSSILSEGSYFGVHFAFTYLLLSPLLLAWPDTTALVLVQAAAVGSTVFGVYLLGRLHCRRAWAAWLMALLAWSHPFFHQLAGQLIDNSMLALPLFVWSVYCWESGRRRAGVALALLLLTTREQAPFLLAGFGLLLAAAGGSVRRRLAGLGIVAGAALVWGAEMWVIRRAAEGWAHPMSYWEPLYGAYGGSLEETLGTALRRPWTFAAALFWPPERLWTPALVLLSLAFLPLASGACLIPALAVWLPHQLAFDPDFHALRGHYANFVAGPLLWACVHGLRRVLRALPREAHRLAACLLLAVCAALFFLSARFLPPADPFSAILRPWRSVVPSALEHVPPGAKLWCDDRILPDVAMRRRLKSLPWIPADHNFEDGLFVPDRVVLTVRWLRFGDRGYRDRILRLLGERRFVQVFRQGGVMVLANPATRGDGAEPVERLSLPLL